MSSRLDITSRQLARGQNDSAAAERLEFPGFRRSWNVRGYRHTARRRGGYTQAGEAGTITYGIRSFGSASAGNYAKVGPTEMANWNAPGTNWTIDFMVFANGIGTGVLNAIGGAGGQNPFLEVWYDDLTMNVKVYMTGGNTHTFTATVEDNVWVPVRIACDGSKIRCYIGSYAAQDYTGTITALSTDSIWLGDDNARSHVPVYFNFFRIFGNPILNRMGMRMLYPRPRDKFVLLNLQRDRGHQDLTDGTTTYQQDISRLHNHAPVTGALTTFVSGHYVFNQWAGDEAEGVRIIADGDLIAGDFA